MGRDALGSGIIVSNYAGVAAGITAITSAISYIFIKKNIYWAAIASYLLMVVTALLVIATTGDMSSPFIALWMLVAVFCGLFGAAGLFSGILFSAGYAAYLILVLGATRYQLTIFVLAYVLPILVSYLIWNKKAIGDHDKNNAYNALAQELSQVANKSEIVINAISDGVIAIDQQGIIQLINPAAQSTTGWSQDDALELDYHSVLKLTDGKDAPLTEVNDVVKQVLMTNKKASREDLVLTTASGKKILISLHVSPLGAPGSGAILVFRDITAQAAEERQQAEFVSTASHEMRTPVAAIEGYLGLALNPATAAIDDKARIYLTKAHESAQHLGRLFQDLLDVSKLEDGRLSNNPVVIDITQTARDITTALTPSAQAKGLILMYKPDITQQSLSPVFYSMLDYDHFREVLSNLIENAIKYTKQGDITVDISGDDEHVVVSVKDTGIGIPKEDIGHLFQKFYRVDSSDTREIGGTGLGLYLSRRLVETMGGRLWVESEYGRGSTFFMEFSRLSHDDAMQYIEKQAQTQAAPPPIIPTPQA